MNMQFILIKVIVGISIRYSPSIVSARLPRAVFRVPLLLYTLRPQPPDLPPSLPREIPIMAENSASSSPPKPLQPTGGGGDQIPAPNLQNPSLSSPPIPPSPSSVDLPQIASPQLAQSQQQITSTGIDFSPKPPATPQQQQVQQQQSNMMSSTSNFQMQPGLQRSGSVQRMNQIQQQFGAAATTSGSMRPGMYGGQMSFSAQQQQQQQQQQPQQQQQQLGGPMARPGMMGQAGPLPMLPSQAAAHFNIQSQMLGQPRQKAGLMQGGQFHTANSSGQSLQGMQAMGLMGPLGLNSQLRANGPLSYGQQRLTPGQIRQQLTQQAALSSPQKLSSQSLQRASSLAAVNPQLSGLPQNGPSALVQGTISTQQWLKQMQSGMPSPVSPSYHIQPQQQRQLSQQLSSQLHQKSLGLSQQQISQLVQHQAQLGSPHQHQAQLLQQQQQLQQLQQLQQQQQQQQQQSPRVTGPAISKSLTGSQPDTTGSGTNITGGSSSQGTEASNQLLGKRKIQDLVSQVDAFGKIDPEVEDLLLELADDFIESVTAFACRLAKHRKSSTLESKDILLHLEKDWHLTIPGFTREEQKSQKHSVPIEVHNKRLEMVRGLMESQQVQRDAIVGRGASKQAAINNAAMDRSVKPPPSSHQLTLPAAGSQVLQKIPRY
ncbi:hypothetical protein AXF42_Ash007934 [Apostasia shenzhenica]|uniref:Transcription initiation factor TFIID subunit 12 domain-containing protein n=1 Tax=Apostasia shenzhenica TaxID=1088818 RepID=A0A2I0B5R2_9ASPA|nr:hypothetical protein AXF42_Ash007934 [Apostasia shenzhenica]